VHGQRAPLAPWFKINFLDFAVAGDHKITWELDRHQHLVTLAKAWLLTLDEKYAKELVAQWYSWQRSNPYPLGINWASSLEVAFRSLSWIWVYHLLAESPALPSDFRSDLVRALAVHGGHIQRYLSTYFSPNTHLLGEALALFFIGTLFPQIPSAGKWKTMGWAILLEEAPSQVLSDGFYFEQSLYYHVYALDFFMHARLLASRNGVEIPSRFDAMIRKMLAVVLGLAQAGPPDGFGDDDGGRLFSPARNRAEHMTDPLALGSAMFHDGRLQARATLTEEAVWLFGDEAVHWLAQPTNTSRAPESQAFSDAGIYLLASSKPSPQQMVIEAGPRSIGWCGHGHADALSVKLSFGARAWLVDSGTLAYITPGGERNAFRGTSAHNTLTVDGLDQAEPAGPFSWSTAPLSDVELWIPGATFKLFVGSHAGYERLAAPVRHRRFVFHLDGFFFLVRDLAEGEGSRLLETSWHFAPDLNVHPRDGGYLATPSDEGHGNAEHCWLLPASDPDWKCALTSGRVSPAYGESVPAPVLRCTARTMLPAEHALLLLPSAGGGDAPGRFFRIHNSSGKTAGTPEAAYQYDQGGFSYLMVFGPGTGKTWNYGPWTSDARFFYCGVQERRVCRLVFCEASFLQVEGQPALSLGGNLQWVDWANQREDGRTLSSDEVAARSFSENVVQSCILK